MIPLRSLPPFLFPLLLSACATAGGRFAPIGPEHPASASAPEVPITDPSSVLRASGSAGHGAHAHVTYVCPMHPDVTSDAPGNCPKCGMQLAPRPEEASEEHQHAH